MTVFANRLVAIAAAIMIAGSSLAAITAVPAAQPGIAVAAAPALA